MQATFVELPAFERIRKDYLDYDAYSALQQELMANPEAGDMIEQTGGCARFAKAIRVEAKANAVACG